MIKVENIEVNGILTAIRGCRNPMNSWSKSDSHPNPDGSIYIGSNDYDLMKRLTLAGSEHRKFLRQIFVAMDITAPLYWWKEFDTYKIGTTANSCSTMHKIHSRPLTLDDFSHEHLIHCKGTVDKDEIDIDFRKSIEKIIEDINLARELYLETKDKKAWWQMIQLLPTSYNQKRTVTLNYEVLLNIYRQRKDHKLDEWRELCRIIKEDLPYPEFITLNFNSIEEETK